MLAHARHGRFCCEKECCFCERVVRILLCDKFKLRLRICEILAPVIKLRQFHSNFRSEWRKTVLFQKALCQVDDFRFISARWFLYPYGEIISAFGGRGGWPQLRCTSEIFSRFIEPRRRRVKGQFGKADPGF